MLEQQLADVQQQLDQVQGELDSLDGRVDMSTATVQLTERGAVVRPALSPAPRLLQAVVDGWSNTMAVVSAVTVGVLSALPLLVVTALGLVLWPRERRPVEARDAAP